MEKGYQLITTRGENINSERGHEFSSPFRNRNTNNADSSEKRPAACFDFKHKDSIVHSILFAYGVAEAEAGLGDLKP